MLPELAAAAAAIAVAGTAAYATLSAGSQLCGPTLIASPDPDEIALTFDDGPNDPCTGQLLDILSEHNVRATFFMIGRFVRQRPDIVRAVHAAGHLVGNHTMTHPWLVVQSPARVRRELADCNAALEDVLGEPVRCFRPPHGARRPDVLRTAGELGLTPVMWNVFGYDWRPRNDAARIHSYVEKGLARHRRAGRGANIVLHDGGQAAIGQDRGATVAAVRSLLRNTDPTRRFVTVDRLRNARFSR
jgi:peptidoglycan/xylan/chitin deacetylase (PgdA/CDA1 family)